MIGTIQKIKGGYNYLVEGNVVASTLTGDTYRLPLLTEEVIKDKGEKQTKFIIGYVEELQPGGGEHLIIDDEADNYEDLSKYYREGNRQTWLVIGDTEPTEADIVMLRQQSCYSQYKDKVAQHNRKFN